MGFMDKFSHYNLVAKNLYASIGFVETGKLMWKQ